MQTLADGTYLTEMSVEPDMVVHICNSSTREDEAGGSWVYSQPGVHNKPYLQQDQNQIQNQNIKRKEDQEEADYSL